MTASRLIEAIRGFANTLITHLNERISEFFVEYLVSITLFLI